MDTPHTIVAQRGSAFVPFSFELDQDWQSALGQLSRLLTDARNALDATGMLSGSGTNEPIGLMTIGTAGALTTSQRVYTAGSTTFAVGDSWLLKAQLAPRFINNVTVVAAPGTFDVVYRFTGGNAAEPPIQPTREGAFCGRPKAEMSTMDTGTAAGKKIIVAGASGSSRSRTGSASRSSCCCTCSGQPTTTRPASVVWSRGGGPAPASSPPTPSAIWRSRPRPAGPAGLLPGRPLRSGGQKPSAPSVDPKGPMS